MRFFLYQFTILCFVFLYRVTTSLSGHHYNRSYSKPQAVWTWQWGLETPKTDPHHSAESPPWPEPPTTCSKFTRKSELCYPLPWSVLPKICAPCSYCNHILKTEIGFTSRGRVWEPYHVFIAKRTSYFKTEICSGKFYCFCHTSDYIG